MDFPMHVVQKVRVNDLCIPVRNLSVFYLEPTPQLDKD